MEEALEGRLIPFLFTVIIIIVMALFFNIVFSRTKGQKRAAEVAAQVASMLGFEFTSEMKNFHVVSSGSEGMRIEISSYFINIDVPVSCRAEFSIEINGPDVEILPENSKHAEKLLEDPEIKHRIRELFGDPESAETNQSKASYLIIETGSGSIENIDIDEQMAEPEIEKYVGFTRWLNRSELTEQLVMEAADAVQAIAGRVERIKA